MKKRSVSPSSLKKESFLGAYIKHRGNISKACAEIDIHRDTYYEWMKSDKEFSSNFKANCKTLEDNLAERAMELADSGDTTLIIFLLKSLNRAKYDDAFARQKYAMKKGLLSEGAVMVPLQVSLAREPEPERLRKPDATTEH